LYVAGDAPAEVPVLYLGADQIDDANGLAYFLKHALQPTRSLAPRLITNAFENSAIAQLATVSWVVVSGSPTPALLEPLKNYLSAGGTLTAILRQPADATWLGTLSGHALNAEEATINGFAMLGRVDFEHPLLRPFDIARFGDFTKIHYWHYRKVTPPPEARVLAWYDDGQPAWFEIAIGKGRILVMTSGWQPSDSQFALSTKFVPLIYTELQRCGHISPRLTQIIIGDPSTLPSDISAVSGPLDPTTAAQLQQPEQNSADKRVEPPGKPAALAAPLTIAQQGLYRIETTSGAVVVAANIDPSESLTAPLALETLEATGVKISQSTTNAAAAAGAAQAQLTAQRLLKVAEIEGRQKSWVWILATVLVILVIETVIAGRATNARASVSETTSSDQPASAAVAPHLMSPGGSS
jgi:hypothetical protein